MRTMVSMIPLPMATYQDFSKAGALIAAEIDRLIRQNVRVDAPAVGSPKSTKNVIAGCIPRLVLPSDLIGLLIDTRKSPDHQGKGSEGRLLKQSLLRDS